MLISNLGELRNFLSSIEDLPDDTPVGQYDERFPFEVNCTEMEVTKATSAAPKGGWYWHEPKNVYDPDVIIVPAIKVG